MRRRDFTIVAGAFMTARPASAQCRYIMNDVGRFHSYLFNPRRESSSKGRCHIAAEDGQDIGSLSGTVIISLPA